jgi:diketogulonate reductase-like aldo/keto reductase
VDTAFVYGTQVALGEALAEFRPKRVFVTTKIPCAGTTAEAAALIAQDLRDLKLRTVDLLVIHNNRDDSHFCNSETNVTATWKALQSAHAAGQARSIVSPPALRLQLIIGSTV